MQRTREHPVALLLALLLALLPVASGCASPATSPAFDAQAATDLFDTMVDRHIEAGYEHPVLRSDDALLSQRKIVVTATINERTAKDVIARLVYLDALDPSKPIDLYISTQGGWYDTAFAVIDAIQLVRAPVNTYAVGGVYSAGAMVLAAGTGQRVAASNCTIMVHANLDDPESSRSASLESRRQHGVWRAHARLPEEWFPLTGERSYYLTAEEAARLRIVDRVADPPGP